MVLKTLYVSRVGLVHYQLDIIMRFKIDKKVAIGQVSNQLTYPFADMLVGHSFKYPAKFAGRISAAIWSYAKAHPGVKFTTRNTQTHGRVWRIK